MTHQGQLELSNCNQAIMPLKLRNALYLIWCFLVILSYSGSNAQDSMEQNALNGTSSLRGRQRRKFGKNREGPGNQTNSSLTDGEAFTGKFGEPSQEDDSGTQLIFLLQRLNDRITSVQTVNDQLLRRFETLEYRITKMEVQMQEKSDGIKTELREVSRRVQQLDWQSSKMETVLESVKLDTAGLTQGLETLRGMLTETKARVFSSAEGRTDGNVHSMLGTIVNILSLTKGFQNSFVQIERNFTNLINMTRPLALLGNKLVTKQDLNLAIIGLKQNSAAPTESLSHCSQKSKEDQNLPTDCKNVLEYGYNTTGVYKIKPTLSSKPFFAYCDLETKGGGWVVIQKRYEGSINFYRNWHDYKHGFGNIAGEFWMGLEKIHLLTNSRINELLIELHDFGQATTFAFYTAFSIGTETEGYPLTVLGSYDGDAGDSLIYHAGMKFSTYDMDNDNWEDGNCAESHTGAWWYNGCDTSNLNGRYLVGEIEGSMEYQGMYWYDWHGPEYSLMKSRISIRPCSDNYVSLITGKKIEHFKNRGKLNKTIDLITSNEKDEDNGE